MRHLIPVLAIFVSSCSTPDEVPLPQKASQQTLAEPVVDRCKIAVPQEGREVPDFKGFSGYLGFTSQYDMLEYIDRLPAPPWRIPTLQKSGPEKWDETSVTVEAKIKATVVDFQLDHKGYGNYDGALTVKLQDERVILIAPKYFVATDWWNCGVADAVKYSPVIAEVQVGAKPLDADGRWANIDASEHVFCTNDGLPGPLTGQDLVSCHRYPTGRLYFDPKSLKVVY